MKKLPLGRQIFEAMRKEYLLYVDKTRYIYDILTGTGANQFFLSRPRRFGKTLLCWTLNALFSGKRELFEGLAIADMDWGWESYPVIHLDMSRVGTDDGPAAFRDLLARRTEDIALEHEIDLRGETDPGGMLDRMITGLSKKHGKPAVVIVDEYDKPFLDFYAKPPVAQEVREIMRNFYVKFKANEQHIRFM
ncbi:MAG: AAA family ATPase, partial [Chitinispirillales bacterium]|nr:AAA family ATPase [Chitinispirillales bacterium]